MLPLGLKEGIMGYPEIVLIATLHTLSVSVLIPRAVASREDRDS